MIFPKASLGLLHGNAVGASDDDGGGHVAEEAVVNNAHGVLELGGGGARVLDGLREVQVHDVVAVVSHSRLVAVRSVGRGGAEAEHGLAAGDGRQRLDEAQGVLVAERGDLHREREARAEAVAELGLVDDDDELVGADLHHLLAEEGAAAALHEVKRRVDLVGAVDGDVELAVLVERRERDAELLGLLLGAHGGRDAHDVGELALLHELAHALHGEGRRRTSAEAHDHAALHVVVNGLVAHLLLELVLRHSRGHAHGRAASARGSEAHGQGQGREKETTHDHLALINLAPKGAKP
mmetsp:Transcript_34219/g.107885  ORF Transcript_34219/g.107885 Transcript_34219/m.107885 type:complete len:295 (+) Transcript_34219:136-1020(+)